MRRLFLWLFVLIVAVFGAGIGWVYTHAPLQSHGGQFGAGQPWRTYAIDLSNTGRWTLTLSGVRVNGQPAQPPFAVMVANFWGGEVTSSALLHSQAGQILETGPVPGWQMEPVRHVNPYVYALRLLLKPESPPVEVTISYRYLGLPMRLTIHEWRLDPGE